VSGKWVRKTVVYESHYGAGRLAGIQFGEDMARIFDDSNGAGGEFSGHKPENGRLSDVGWR